MFKFKFKLKKKKRNLPQVDFGHSFATRPQ